ncbi:MAG: NAD(P)(+) transhydrogenase (Re/Si-specific) subunit beta [Holosporales bacterium]|jgi:NAD(P) transhydrogenase subunit beta|nr:NAD(P)(+) transhydrogenase (Re/Si-specific) subunit beta [Holosporales bacterium]
MYAYLYLISAILFILSLRGLSSAKSSQIGNMLGMFGMGIAIITTICLPSVMTYKFIIIGLALGGVVGYLIAKRVNMTDLPQLIAAFHSLVGLAAVCVALSAFYNPGSFGIFNLIPKVSLVEMSLGAAIGAITLAGSIVAFGKLSGFIKGKTLLFKFQHKLNLIIGIVLVLLIILFIKSQSETIFITTIIFSVILGFFLIMPIGGADMPVIVSMLNSYSGWAAAGIGLTIQNDLLIITGALVGTSGAILSHIMCKGMNRSLINVMIGGLGESATIETTFETGGPKSHIGNVKLCSPEDAAFIIKNAETVVIVPGYGMAVSQAQHVIKQITDICKADGIKTRFAIHPVAGRMPGHMNVLLAEANIDYDDVLEIDEINHDFANTDVAIVVGANDITNPAAKNDPTSPIYGMPILDVEKARTVLFVKRSLGSGYAGIDNSLFYKSNTMMILGDAKTVSENILRAMKE